jgi:spore maturation protein CgeB
LLKPPPEEKEHEIFFTLWNYERMQFQWAKEQGLATTNLQEIKQAQIEWFKPDVFYDFSAMLDTDFLARYPISQHIQTVAWYGIIEAEPLTFDLYDWRVTLHRPYIQQWKNKNLSCFELQPAFDPRWEHYDYHEKPIDILFYGQFLNRMFRNRNRFMTDLIRYAQDHPDLNIKVHLQLQSKRKVRKQWMGIHIPGWYEEFPSEYVTQHALPPIYGRQLYETIGRSKFVINGYTNQNKAFKSNMRLFESLGCGALLISEKGYYPEGFKEYIHYYPYDVVGSKKLFQQLPEWIAGYPQRRMETKPMIQELKEQYNKEAQWKTFKEMISL